jgi:electron transport complex protein RnfD
MSSTPAPSRLLVQTGPFLRQGLTTPRLMGDVLIAVVPVLGAAVWYFGVSALLVCLSASLGAVGFEALLIKRGPGGAVWKDGSAALTGVLLGLTLPPGLPLWMAFLGGVAGIGLGKLAWGGLGHNLFNPALVGRAFLQAAFPVAITTWDPPTGIASIHRSNFAWPFMHATPDAVTAATPLNLMKFAHQTAGTLDLVRGNIAGSLGETSAAIIILAGIYLVWRRAFDWRIPVSIVVTVGVFSGILHLIAPATYPSPLFMLFAGGLLFGAVFMATDPVTSPVSPTGSLLFGFGIGVLVVLIRIWGGLPEGVMYAILLMNAVAPLIERSTQPRAFGHARRK